MNRSKMFVILLVLAAITLALAANTANVSIKEFDVPTPNSRPQRYGVTTQLPVSLRT